MRLNFLMTIIASKLCANTYKMPVYKSYFIIKTKKKILIEREAI